VIRPGGPQDLPFMRDMLRHAYYWRVDRVSSTGEPPVRRYVERWGRPGDTALIAIQDFQRVGAAWYRLFTAEQPGYGFVDEKTPELGIAVVPLHRRKGIGETLLRALMVQAREEGYQALSLSVAVHNRSRMMYERAGFEPVREEAEGEFWVMRAELG